MAQAVKCDEIVCLDAGRFVTARLENIYRSPQVRGGQERRGLNYAADRPM